MNITDQKVGAVLVVGGGISGMQSALDLADSGFKVYLVEKSPAIGGVMSLLDKTFPTNDCAMCIMAPKLVATGRHHNITLLTNTSVEQVDGEAGAFKVKVLKKARYVDEDKCTGCSICIQKCPKKVPNEHEHNLADRKAVHLPYLQAVPNVPTIDPKNCIYFKTGKCSACKKACTADAIDFDQKDERLTLDVGSIILSPGSSRFDARYKGEYGYGTYKNVITSMELENMLNASGPTGGDITRPSDGKVPERIAILQCVGSRDEKVDATYCSSVCCMYSIKEAIIAKEHSEAIDPTIFYMDIRAHGKDFERYFNRAKNEYGIRFVGSRVASIEEDTNTGNLILHYVDGNRSVTEEFDMVVLAIGLRPPIGVELLSKVFAIDLNHDGFCSSTPFSPLDTSRKGVFVGGTFAGPKDIPETVTQASGAAARATSLIADVRNSQVVEKQFPQEIELEPEGEPRIGVFVCHCGINIGSIVDVPKVVEYAKTLKDVVFADQNMYTCSQDTQETIKETIKEHRLNRVVVASCTPRTHEPLFQNTCREVGLNPYLFEMANIREHCSWVHSGEPDAATEKAKDLVRMAIAKSRLQEPLYESYRKVEKSGLVIGGGLAGITAALGLAEQGFNVHLIEKEKELGGILGRIHSLPGTDDDPRTELERLINEVTSNERIKVLTGSMVTSVSGSVGDFTTIVKTENTESTVQHGIIIVAIGGVEYEPVEYLYGKDPSVMTQLQFEEKLTKGEIEGKTFVMIQCVGARNQDWPNCGRICCIEALKNALLLKSKAPESVILILNRDIRSYGFHEELYRQARRKGVLFITYDDETLPEVSEDDGRIRVEFHDPILERNVTVRPDNLILSVATRPSPTTKDIATMLKVPTTSDGFFLEAHMKIRPVDFATEGIFLCGLAHGPKLVDETISQASAAVSRATTILSKERIEIEPIRSAVIDENCDGCAYCIDPCPYNAITLLEYKQEGKDKKTVRVDDSACKGCGICMATCPKEAIVVKGFKLDQLKAMINAALGVE